MLQYSRSDLKRIAKNPGLENTIKGNILDARVKKLVSEDENLPMLHAAPNGRYGPDWIRTDISRNPNEPRWYGLTTTGEWGNHVYKYAPGFGQGVGVLWK